MIHTVTCAICGKRGKVHIRENGKIIGDAFWYWGKININSQRTDKFYYECKFDKKGHFTEKFKKIVNKEYDTDAKPILMEYWECRKCYSSAMKKENDKEP